MELNGVSCFDKLKKRFFGSPGYYVYNPITINVSHSVTPWFPVTYNILSFRVIFPCGRVLGYYSDETVVRLWKVGYWSFVHGLYFVRLCGDTNNYRNEGSSH